MTLPLSYSRGNPSTPKALVETKRTSGAEALIRPASAARLKAVPFDRTVYGLKLMLIVSVADKLLLVPTKILELMTGIEPVTSPLPRECSTN